MFALRNRFQPVDSLLELQRELDRFVRTPASFEPGPSGSGVFPPVNVFRDEGSLVVRAEVPGIEPDSISVGLEGRTLTIAGERQPNESNKGSYHRRERAFGKFSRSLSVPADLDTEKASAECRNGVLTIRIPKAEASKPRTLKVAAK